jgi:hypothetical protein
VNDAPVLAFINDIIKIEGETVIVNPTATDVENDSLVFRYQSPLDQNGQWITDFNNSGMYFITISVSDGNGGIDSQVVMITINEFGNHDPVLEPISDVTVTEGQIVTVNPVASDLDNDLLTFSFTAPFDSNGQWQTGFMDAGVYIASASVTDGLVTATQSFTITVQEAGNQAPVFDTINELSVVEGGIIKVVPIVNDPDGDNVTITYNLPLDSNGEWQPGFTDAGSYQVTIDATDGQLTSSETFTIIVTEAGNQVPVIDDLNNITITEGGFIKITPTGNDADGDVLTFEYSIPLNSSGEWLTTFADAGQYNIIVTALDGNGGSDSTSFTLIVLESGNHEPIVEDILDITVIEGEVAQVNLVASDPDGDILIVTYSDKFNGSGQWKTTFVDAGQYPITVDVSDGSLTVSKQFFVNVVEIGNHQPTFEISGNFNVQEGETVKIKVDATDIDQDQLTITISDPVGNDGVWDTTGFGPGSYSVTVYVSDGTITLSEVITIIIAEKPFEQLYFGNIRFINGEDVQAGDYLDIDVSFTNLGNKEMREVKVVVLDYETGERYATNPITLSKGDTETKKLRFYVPEFARKGWHNLRFVISNDNIRRVRHRDYYVE